MDEPPPLKGSGFRALKRTGVEHVKRTLNRSDKSNVLSGAGPPWMCTPPHIRVTRTRDRSPGR